MNRMGLGPGGLDSQGLSSLSFTLGQHGGLNQPGITLGGGVPLGAYSDGIALFSQFGQLFPQLNPQAQQQQSNDVSTRLDCDSMRGEGSRGGGEEGKSGSAYASRHQAAEQRRRTRINERLDLLRKMVPHTDRANTASFLEEVLKYIDVLKTRVAELETTLVALKTQGNQYGGGDLRLSLNGNGTVKADMQVLAREQHAVVLPQFAHLNNVGYSLQQLQQQQIQQQQIQQQQLQQQLQQQQIQQIQHHEAALAALREEQQQQTAAILAARQTSQMADLAAQLGLKNVHGLGQGPQSGGKADAGGMDALNMLANQASKDAGRVHGGAGPSPLGLQLPPVQQLQVAGGGAGDSTGAMASAGSAPSGTVSAAAQPSGQKSGAAATSPASSEDSGVPPKKRKVLVL